MSPFRLAAAALIAISLSTPAAGQTSEGSLRAEQARLFDQIFERPDDLDLMFQYALVSIELQDFEAAISILDRILIFNPDLPRVRLELGAAYFRIGAYQFAREYFDEASAHPEASEAVKARAAEFLNAIEQRTRKNYITGIAQASALFSTNANNGPSSRDIEFLGFAARLTGDDVTAQTDVGASINLQATHVYDFEGKNADSWRTNAVVYSQRYASTKDGAADVLVLRTGPRISLEDDRYGLKARPFVELDHVRSALDALYSTAAIGVELQDTIDRNLGVGGAVQVGWREYEDSEALDGINARGFGGITYALSEATTTRMRLLFEYEGTEDRSERSYEFGLEGGVSHRYDSGFDFAARRWVASANGRVSGRFFDQPGIANPATTRSDLDLRLGLSNLAHLENGLSIETRVDYLMRDSNIRNFDVESLTLTIGGRVEF